MVFYTCAICEIEDGLDNMYEIEDVQSRIDASDINKLFTCMLQPLYDENATVYAQAAFDELDCGLLKYSKHACKTCVKQYQLFRSAVNGPIVGSWTCLTIVVSQ